MINDIGDVGVVNMKWIKIEILKCIERWLKFFEEMILWLKWFLKIGVIKEFYFELFIDVNEVVIVDVEVEIVVLDVYVEKVVLDVDNELKK